MVSHAPTAEAVDTDPAPDHDVRAVLRLVPFRRLWLADGLSSLGDWLGLFATAALARSLAGDSDAAKNFAFAGVFMLRLAPAVVLGPLAGAMADRLDRRLTMVVGDLLRFALFASIVLVGTLPWLFIATVLIECVALFWGPANDATIPNLVPRRRLEAANQLNLAATYGSAPVAAGLYAVLAAVADSMTAATGPGDINPLTVKVALWVNALTFLVSALVVSRLHLPDTGAREAARERGVMGSILDGWRFVGTSRVARGLVLGMLGAFAAGGFVVGLSQTYVNDLDAGQAGFGVLFGAVFIGLAVGMWVGPRALGGFSRRRLFGLALVAAGGSLVGLALMLNLVVAVLFTVAVGVCGGVAWVTGYTLLGLEVGDEVRGRTFAFLNSASRVVLVLVLGAGPAAAALIGTHTVSLPGGASLQYRGAAWVFALAGLIAMLTGAIAYRQMNERKGTPLHADRAKARASRQGAPRSGARPHSGWFIAFEGGDGTGKSTQARLLADWLRGDQGHDVVLTREPGATAVGVRLREVLLGEGEAVGPRAEALLFAADRAHHVDSLVAPALARGAIVITDRYVDSSIAYQGAGRSLDVEDVDYISRWATGGLAPDLTVLLDVPPEISRVRRANDPTRTGADKLESQPADFHERARHGFLELARREPGRYLVLDGSDPRKEIQDAIRARVRDIVPISRKRRAELAARLAAEEDARRRRAAAEAEVLRLDAELRGRSRDEALERQEARRRAREEAERQLQEEAERQLQEETRLAVEALAGEEIVAALAQPTSPVDTTIGEAGPEAGPEAATGDPAPEVSPSPRPIADSFPTSLPAPIPPGVASPGRLAEPVDRAAPDALAVADTGDAVRAEPSAPAPARRSGRHAGEHTLIVPVRPWFSADSEETPRPPVPTRHWATEPDDVVEDLGPEDGAPVSGSLWLGETESLPIVSDPIGRVGPEVPNGLSARTERARADVPDPPTAGDVAAAADRESDDQFDLREEIFGHRGLW